MFDDNSPSGKRNEGDGGAPVLLEFPRCPIVPRCLRQQLG